jgi:hypothetical protein
MRFRAVNAGIGAVERKDPDILKMDVLQMRCNRSDEPPSECGLDGWASIEGRSRPVACCGQRKPRLGF